jgi:GT2 family glycosyltransferase
MSGLKAAVVILNYNGKHFLEKFLPGIVAHSQPHDIYIADNASTDDSLQFVATAFPQVRVISNDGNHGYAKGYNDALRLVDADVCVLLNNDVEVSANWLDPMVKMMSDDPLLGACQPKLLDYSRRDIFEYAGAAGGFIDSLGYPFCRGRMFNTVEADRGQYNSDDQIFWASGAAMCVRMDAFRKAGGFDDDYFAHMEEIDLCWRMKNLGYIIRNCGSSHVYHIGGGTLSKISPKKTELNFRNNLATLVKNNPPGTLIWKLMVRLVLDGIAGLKFLFEGQPAHCAAVIKAHFTFYSWIPSLLKKRKALRSLPSFRFSQGAVYKGSVVMDYHLRKRRFFAQLDRGFFTE